MVRREDQAARAKKSSITTSGVQYQLDSYLLLDYRAVGVDQVVLNTELMYGSKKFKQMLEKNAIVVKQSFVPTAASKAGYIGAN